MNANLTPTDIKDTNREAEAIVLLHAHRDVIMDALANSDNPLAKFTATELNDFFV